MLSALNIILLTVIAIAFVRSDDSKIVGGQFVDAIESIPFIISIHVKIQGHNCGGSLLTPFYILTACHCLAAIPDDEDFEVQLYNPKDLLFVAGAIDFEADMGRAQVRDPSKLLIHPDCSKRLSIIQDFGVGEVMVQFEITERVRPIKLLTTHPEEFRNKFFSVVAREDTECRVAGWGETRRGDIEKPKASTKLKSLRMFLIPEKKCQTLYGERDKRFLHFPFMANDQICAVSENLNESDCIGDSGSPFYCNEYVIGVVSYGYECGTHMPSVYTELRGFLKWFMTDVYPHRPSRMSVDYLNIITINGTSKPTFRDKPTVRNYTPRVYVSFAYYKLPYILHLIWVSVSYVKNSMEFRN